MRNPEIAMVRYVQAKVSKEVTMYWLRWHYHVKDIAGAPYKIKKKERKKRKEKQNNRIADSQ